MKKLVIIDGKSVFYRGYYAMGNLSKSDGTPTGGIYGFAVIALEIVKEIQPTSLLIEVDSNVTLRIDKNMVAGAPGMTEQTK